LHTLDGGNRFDRSETFFANRKTRDIYERKTTETTIGGEENRENGAYYSNHWRDEDSTLLGALDSSLSH
jgi:hypothetical protein